MTGIEKWLPFKFPRKKAAEKSAPVEERAPLARRGDPFSWMEELLRGFGPRELPLSRFTDEAFFGDFSDRGFVPRVDVVEEEDAIVVTAELPGLERKDLRLEVQEGVLVVGGEKKHEEETRENGCYHVERSFGSFTRTLPLPRGVDVAKAEATLEHGVLKVRFPRTAEKETTRKIEVKAT